MRTVLIIDDNPAVGEALSLALSLHEIRPLTALTPEQGLAMLETERVDVVIQDMNFTADTTSGEEGIALFRDIRLRHTDLPVILLTAWTHLETAVELVKAGAADYLAKPWDDNKLLATVENLLELSESTREVTRARNERRKRREDLQRRYDLNGIVFASEAMARTLDLACQVARSDVPVLITGPNGAGKERIAAIVHANSAVKRGAFVAVNCGALPGELIEAELFGADAGAYTGANKAREGRFELADGGTLFLDEIGDMSLPMQVKLLRVLQERVFERVGSNRTQRCDVRIIAATHRNLEEAIAHGQFREDLFYRLSVFPLEMPALREHLDDLSELVDEFNHRLSRRGLGSVRFSAGAMNALHNYAWPGNVRELYNLVERLSILYPHSEVRVGDLPEKYRGQQIVEEVRGAALLSLMTGQPATPTEPMAAVSSESLMMLPEGGLDLKDHLADIEVGLIRQALDVTGGVVAHAAKLLRMQRTTLVEKLRKYGLQPSLQA